MLVGSLRSSYQGFRAFDMFLSEEKLAVEIAEVDSVEVHNMDFPEPSKDEVLEEFAANAASANHENAGLA